MKVAVNSCYGGFGLSEAAYAELGFPWDGYGYAGNELFGIEGEDYNAYRSHPKLISMIENIGCKEASGDMASIRIVDVPDDVRWYIHDYDGMESVEEQHRSW